MTIHAYLPNEWIEFHMRLRKNHRDLWIAVQNMDYADAVPYLNTVLKVQVPTDALLSDAGRIYLDALIKKEGAIILIDGKGYSK